MKQRNAVISLVIAGAIWGSSVALSKLSLGWLDATWLTALRFGVAAPVLALIARRALRHAFNFRVIFAGAVGYGVTMLLQNAGIEHTSVSHAAIIVGAVPVMVAIVSAGLGQGRASGVAWSGYAVALLGIVFVAKGGGGGASSGGDLLVLASVVMSAAMIAMQPRLLAGQDAAAVTAVQFAAASLVALPLALVRGGLPHAPTTAGPVIAFVVLALLGTVVPFWLFAYGQKVTSAEFAGAMVNVEPLVGAAVGWVAFADPVGVWQLVGAAAVVAGILLSTVPWARVTFSGLPQRLQARVELP